MASVAMFHPASDRRQRASARAFEQVWSKEGWILVEDATEDTPLGDGGESGSDGVSPPSDPAARVDMPTGMSVPATLAWVAGDPEKARVALMAETIGKARQTLIARLEETLTHDGES